MPVYYTTVNDVQEQLMKVTPEDVPDPTTVEYTNFVNYLTNQVIPDSSTYLENLTHRFFVPKYATENLYNRVLAQDNSQETHGYWYKAREFRLYLALDLLEIVTYTSTATTITSTEYRVAGVPGIALDLDFDSNDFDFDTGAFNNAQVLLGWWGYHTDWSNAFSDVETLTLDDNQTDITVVASAFDKYKYPQYVRCEDEIMLITSITDATTIVVERGVRGTTAASHSSKALSTFSIDNALHIAATRMVAWLYTNRVSQGNIVQLSDSSILLDQMPTMVKDNLTRLTKRGAV